jgi:hypothetical protein
VIRALVRFCPKGEPSTDVIRDFPEAPRKGDGILHEDNERYVVVQADWVLNGSLFIVVHHESRRSVSP